MGLFSKKKPAPTPDDDIDDEELVMYEEEEDEQGKEQPTRDPSDTDHTIQRQVGENTDKRK